MAFRRRNKSYPFFSQEFLIQNHADIVLCLVVFILLGLMFERGRCHYIATDGGTAPPPSSTSSLLSSSMRWFRSISLM
uniref:Translocation associated membrane protein 2 n=1 Tax=Paramormyrops kingsleyae TaxID=1676925 RepID=A0A3B3RPB5_9TELE